MTMIMTMTMTMTTVISDQKVEEGRKDRYIPEEEKGIRQGRH